MSVGWVVTLCSNSPSSACAQSYRSTRRNSTSPIATVLWVRAKTIRIPGTRKVDIAERTAKAIDSSIEIEKVFDSFVSERGFDALIDADYVFGCLDSEGARLLLTELCAAYAKPYVDVSSDILADDPVKYGGQVCVALSGNGCLSCMNVLDSAQAAIDLAGPEERRRLADIYGVSSDLLDNAGPAFATQTGCSHTTA